MSDASLIDGYLMLLRSRSSDYRREKDIEKLAETQPRLAEKLRKEWAK